MNKKELYNINENCYYVYEHILDGKVFYVGKGKGNRIFDLERNESWVKLTEGNLHKVEFSIKGYFFDEKDAYAFEQLLIDKYLSEGEELTNYEYNYNHIASKNNETKNNKNEKTTIQLESNFNHYKQALSLMKKIIKRNEKVVIFFDSKNSSLINEVLKDKTFECANIKQSTCGKNRISIPDSFNVLLYPSSLLLIDNSSINYTNVGLVIMIMKSERRKMIAINRFKEIRILATKVSKKEKINFDLIIPKKYIGTPLMNSDKNKLCEILGLTNCNGHLLKWRAIKDLLIKNDSGYLVSNGTKIINNKRTRITTISLKQKSNNQQIKKTLKNL